MSQSAEDSAQLEREEDEGPPPERAGLADELFAAGVREQRERQKMSQGELARRMAARGFPYYQQTVRRIEDGKRKVSVGEAKALAQILETTMDRLTLPGREASYASMLSDFTIRADHAWGQVSAWTVSLLQARWQLDLTVTQADAADCLGSAEIRKLAADAREAMKLTPDEALAAGRREFAELRKAGAEMAASCPPLDAEDGDERS